MPKTTTETPKPRRARGMGSVYPVTIKGVVYQQAAKSFTYTDEHGHKIRKRVTGTGIRESDAIRALDRNVQRYLNPDAVPEQRPGLKPPVKKTVITYEEWFRIWISEIPTYRASPPVIQKYKRMGEMYLLPALGDRPIDSIDEEDIRTLVWKELMSYSELSEATIRNIYRVLSMSFKAAVETRRVPISVNPAVTVRTPAKKAPQGDISNEVRAAKAVIEYLRDPRNPDGPRFLLMWMGLRRAERLAIAHSDISDLWVDGRARIRIHQQIARHQDGSGWYLKDRLKSKTGERELPLVEPFLSAVRRQVRMQEEWKAEALAAGKTWGGPDGRFADLIFLTRDGDFYRPNFDNAQWHKLSRAQGGMYYRSHLNRHITASLLSEAGVPVSIARDLLGHNSDAMTYFYTHISNAAKRPALESYADALLTPPIGPQVNEHDAAYQEKQQLRWEQERWEHAKLLAKQKNGEKLRE